MIRDKLRRQGRPRTLAGAAGCAVLGLVAALAAPVRAQDTKAISQAIARGAEYLKAAQLNTKGPGVGANALVGLTLVACGVPADDPAMRRFAAIVRRASPTLTHTYSVSLAIMFLDSLGDPADVPLIQSLGVRLLAGQNSAGGWSYDCPSVGEREVRRLKDLLGQRNELRGSREAPRPSPAGLPERPELPKEIQNQLRQLSQVRANLRPSARFTSHGDNSNTQFATLGLWVARRHGLPVDKALLRVAQRFLTSQNADGGWGYSGTMHSTGTMTCAGLIGLAAGYGTVNEAALRTAAGADDLSREKPAKLLDPGRDPAVRAALLRLAQEIGPPAGPANARAQAIPRGFGKQVYYFFWSLERVGVLYDLTTIGRIDWYAWGSEVLVASQAADGSWEGQRGAAVDSCFALLFLARANLARDLTARLKGRVRDPGEVALRSGGAGGLLGPGLIPGAGPGGRPGTVEEEDLEAQAARLSMQLLLAPAGQQEKLLEQFKQAKGVAYTQALAAAIPQLARVVQGPARDALAERLSRMTAATLRGRLKDADAELRGAAARACAARDDPTLAPELIALLEDAEPWVARTARTALKILAGGQDFGPSAQATPAERAEAVAAWKSWWQAHPAGPKSK